jgi:hypothetical protein
MRRRWRLARLELHPRCWAASAGPLTRIDQLPPRFASRPSRVNLITLKSLLAAPAAAALGARERLCRRRRQRPATTGCLPTRPPACLPPLVTKPY